MARVVISSINGSDTATAVQIFSVAAPRVLSITMKARTGNAGSVYIADDSAAKSSGLELQSGDREDWDFSPTSIAGNSFWVFFSSSGDDLDYAALMEN